MRVVVWGRDVVTRYLHDIRAGGRHDLGGIALVTDGDWTHTYRFGHFEGLLGN